MNEFQAAMRQAAALLLVLASVVLMLLAYVRLARPADYLQDAHLLRPQALMGVGIVLQSLLWLYDFPPSRWLQSAQWLTLAVVAVANLWILMALVRAVITRERAVRDGRLRHR